MPVSGIVLTIDPTRSAPCLAGLRRIPGVELGQPAGCKVPLALDTPDPDADRVAWQQLRLLPGVRHVDVVFIHFDAAAGPLSGVEGEP